MLKQIWHITALTLLLFATLHSDSFAELKSKKELPEKLPKKLKEELITMDFKDADLLSVIKFISDLTGENFLVDDKVRGKVTIFSPTKVSVPEAYVVFKSILEIYGFTAVPSGNVTKIIPIADAKQKSIQTVTEGMESLSEDRVITRLIPLKHIDSNMILPVIKPLLSNSSFATSYIPANKLIVTDLASNIDKLLEIIKDLDVEAVTGETSEIEIVELKYADARIIAGKIEGIFDASLLTQENKGHPELKPGKLVKIIPEERTNSIILIAGKKYIDDAKKLILDLDKEAPSGKGKFNVYNLKNAGSEELGKVLQNLTAKVGKPDAAQGKQMMELKEEVTVVPYNSTNSLIVIASPQDFEIITKVIEQLDVRRPQVFVEALIMEVSSTKANEFGIEWRTTSPLGEPGVKPFGGTNLQNMNNLSADPIGDTKGLLIGVADGTFEFNGQTFLNIGALLKAIQTEDGINILSTPNILTTDNEEAEIMVGENIPVSKGESRDTGGNIINNIERKDIGLILKIKPQISESNYVKLAIQQELSSVSDVQAGDITNPVYLKRNAKTTVVVKNGQNVVIGGLVKEDMKENVTKVPLLGDIPLLGWFFKYKSTQLVKTNLMIFISPHIVRTDADIENLSRGKILEMRESQKSEKEKSSKKAEDKKM